VPGMRYPSARFPFLTPLMKERHCVGAKTRFGPLALSLLSRTATRDSCDATSIQSPWAQRELLRQLAPSGPVGRIKHLLFRESAVVPHSALSS
jgi:hypothetical protein